MPEYVVHIGPHKTGTTYLQLLFQQTCDELRGRGILYPSDWIPAHSPGHYMLFQALQHENDFSLENRFRELNASDFKVILISAEDLSYLTQPQIRRFHSLIAGMPVKVIFYCRRWTELLPSAWQETVKQGRTCTFPEFVLHHLANCFTSSLINYCTVLDPWANVFGTSNIVLVSYSNLADSHEDLFWHFLRSFLGYDSPPAYNEFRVNVSRSLFDIETIRMLNVLEQATTGTCNFEIRERYEKFKQTLDIAELFKAMEKDVGELPIDDASRCLRVVHQETYERYGRCMVAPFGSAGLFAPRRTALPFIRQNYLLADGVPERFKRLYHQISGN